MKKLIGMLALFVFSLFIANAQSKVMFVDSLKTVTVNVSTDNVKKQANSLDNLQELLATSIDNQTKVNQSLSESLTQFTSVASGYIQTVEERNKSDDQQAFLAKFGYTLKDVSKGLKIERVLNLIMAVILLLYFIYVNRELSIRDSAPNLTAKGLLYLASGIVLFLVLNWTLTLVFNSTFFKIKELIALYT